MMTWQNEFVESFNRMSDVVLAHTFEKGFRVVGEDRNLGEQMALIHSEISEALEGIRHGNPPDDKIPEFFSTEAELADAVIRIMETARFHKWRLAEAIVAKVEFNKTRPYKHGKEF